MLRIHVPGGEFWDPEHETFLYAKDTELCLEHSLVSISKWESKWHKAFLGKAKQTEEEGLDYIACMTTTKNVDPAVYSRLTSENIKAINDYIREPMTCVRFNDPAANEAPQSKKDTVTSELIYYWMFTLNIPIECEKWHLNRLLALIRVCELKTAPKKKGNQKNLRVQYAAINAARCRELGTHG